MGQMQLVDESQEGMMIAQGDPWTIEI